MAKTRAELEAALKKVSQQGETHVNALSAAGDALMAMAKVKPDDFMHGDGLDAYQAQIEQIAELTVVTLGLALVETAIEVKLAEMDADEEAGQ